MKFHLCDGPRSAVSFSSKSQRRILCQHSVTRRASGSRSSTRIMGRMDASLLAVVVAVADKERVGPLTLERRCGCVMQPKEKELLMVRRSRRLTRARIERGVYRLMLMKEVCISSRLS